MYLASRIYNAEDEDHQIEICNKFKVKLTKHGQINRQSNLGKLLQLKLDALVLGDEVPMIEEQPIQEEPLQTQNKEQVQRVSQENPEFVDYTNLQSILSHYSNWTSEQKQ